jgi:3-dehydroquinate dehydratase/shikimate dehydrogenase
MTLIATPIFVSALEEVEPALDLARRAVARGASVIEWRVDGLPGTAGPSAGRVLDELASRSPAPCIVTCRTVEEGGQGGADDLLRVVELLAASQASPRYLDVELAAFGRSAALRVACAKVVARQTANDTGLILSVHDMAGRPADLLQRVEAMTAEPACRVIKVAWTARSVRDNLETFDLLSERRRPTIALCMGDAGLMSRVLAGKFGGLITFAANAGGAESAPGQPTIETLRETYRFDAIGAATKVYGVVGWPVAHSRGPAIHNAGFAAAGHDGVYLPLPVPPGYEHFKASVGSLLDHPRLSFAGASVTVPHKENLLRFVRERGGAVCPVAQRVGAANTLLARDDGTVACLNTDGPAALDALAAGMGGDPAALARARVLVLGAGGAARAVVGALAGAGSDVVVFNRSSDRARALAADLGARAADEDVAGAGPFDVVVNCTTVGMQGGPDPEGLPLPPGVTLDGSITVFDTVYAPPRTPLIREAEARGARIVTGADMFLRQAALQFERWTGKPAPMAAFRAGLAP